MRLGLGLGPLYVSGRVPTGRAPRRWLSRRSNGFWGWIAVLWAIGSLMSMCDGHPHGTQPTQVTPPLAPITTTPTTTHTLPTITDGHGHTIVGDPDFPPPGWVNDSPTTVPPGCNRDGCSWPDGPYNRPTTTPTTTRPGDCWDDATEPGCGYTPTYVPPTTLPPAPPLTLLPQQTVPGVPMVPPPGQEGT
jgi:hypothetical protein